MNEPKLIRLFIPHCLKCESSNVSKIVWGLADPDYGEQYSNRDRITFGGCLLSGEDPDYVCQECHYEFTRKDYRQYKQKNKILIIYPY